MPAHPGRGRRRVLLGCHVRIRRTRTPWCIRPGFGVHFMGDLRGCLYQSPCGIRLVCSGSRIWGSTFPTSTCCQTVSRSVSGRLHSGLLQIADLTILVVHMRYQSSRSSAASTPVRRTRLKFGSSLRNSMEYIGPWVLAQQSVLLGVLAQVTELEPPVLAGQHV
jgi:hypothetical protein